MVAAGVAMEKCLPVAVPLAYVGVSVFLRSTPIHDLPAVRLDIPGEDAVPVVLHADHGPAIVAGFSHQRLGERADVGVR